MRQSTVETIALVYQYGRLRKFYAELESKSLALQERYSWWPCRQFCSDCCRPSLFLVSEIEARYLLAGFAKLDKYKRREIQAKARSIVSQVHQKIGYVGWTQIVETLGKEEYPCPLLDEQCGCVLYDYRGAICRIFGFHLLNMDGQAYWCQKVEDAVREHRETEQVQAFMFGPVAERMKEVLVGDKAPKPVAAWLAEC